MFSTLEMLNQNLPLQKSCKVRSLPRFRHHTRSNMIVSLAEVPAAYLVDGSLPLVLQVHFDRVLMHAGWQGGWRTMLEEVQNPAGKSS